MDEHAVDTDADPARVWAALPGTITAALTGRRGPWLTHALACRCDGDPARFAPVAGVTVPGFRVARVEPRRLLRRIARRAETYTSICNKEDR